MAWHGAGYGTGNRARDGRTGHGAGHGLSVCLGMGLDLVLATLWLGKELGIRMNMRMDMGLGMKVCQGWRKYVLIVNYKFLNFLVNFAEAIT